MHAIDLRWVSAALAMAGDRSTPRPRLATGNDAAATDPEAALAALFVAVEVPLTNVVYRWLWDREEARDVIQDAFLRMWKMGDRVDWERAEPLVYRIALNLAANRRRWRKLRRFVGLEAEASPAPGADDALDAARRSRAVVEVIEGLSEAHRRVLTLDAFTELSHAEIGKILGIPAGTVASRKHAAIARLRRALGES
jgi:RNA polymerase sigma-70 factor (ECF subfamily)